MFLNNLLCFKTKNIANDVTYWSIINFYIHYVCLTPPYWFPYFLLHSTVLVKKIKFKLLFSFPEFSFMF